MINNVYQLVGTRTLVVKFEDLSLNSGLVVVRPDHLAICHADQRYYLGQRDRSVLERKLPMAPIHEATGTVLNDPSGSLARGQRVALIPNVVGTSGELEAEVAEAAAGAEAVEAAEAAATGVPPTTTPELYENYAPNAAFRSSGRDGFLSELVALPPSRVVPTGDIAPEVAAITEFVSVALHALTRFDALAHTRRARLAVIGDGSMAYVVATMLRECFPSAQLIVLGRHEEKLALFSFADETYYSESLPADLSFDHAFECTGAQGSTPALEALIAHIRPQGTIVLLGVSEQPVAIATRMVLEKGLTLVGCSRSGRADFEKAVSLMSSQTVQQRLRQIIYVDEPVHTVADIKRVFATDLSTSFKTVFAWRA